MFTETLLLLVYSLSVIAIAMLTQLNLMSKKAAFVSESQTKGEL